MAKITYEEKNFLNKNESIQDINKVNDTDLNEIKEVINENDDNVGDLSNLNTTDKSSVVNAINAVNNKGIYSTEEQPIGTWIDGKTIYRKIIDLGSFQFQNGVKNVTIPNTSIETLIKGSWVYKLSNKWYFDYTTPDNIQYINATTLTVGGNENFTCQQFYITLEYTKPEEM